MFYIKIKTDGDGEFKVTRRGEEITKEAFYKSYAISSEDISKERDILKNMTLSFNNGHISPHAAKAFYAMLRKIRKYSGVDFDISLTISKIESKSFFYFFKRESTVSTYNIIYKVTDSKRHMVKTVYSGDVNKIVVIT